MLKYFLTQLCDNVVRIILHNACCILANYQFTFWRKIIIGQWVRIIDSKVTAILLNWWILPIGGDAMEGSVPAASFEISKVDNNYKVTINKFWKIHHKVKIAKQQSWYLARVFLTPSLLLLQSTLCQTSSLLSITSDLCSAAGRDHQLGAHQ